MDSLDKSVMRFYETQFCDLVKSEEWLSLSEPEVARLVSSDGVVAPENIIIDSILSWWTHSASGDPDVLNNLLSHVRWSLCPPSFLQSLEAVEDDKYTPVVHSLAYKQFRKRYWLLKV